MTRIAKIVTSTAVAITAGVDTALLGDGSLLLRVHPTIGPLVGWAGLAGSILYFNHNQKFDRHSYGWCFRHLAVALVTFVLASSWLI